MTALGWILLFLVVISVLGWQRASRSVFSIGLAVYLLLVSFFSYLSLWSIGVLWFLYLCLVLPLLIAPLRRRFLSTPALKIFKKSLPHLSKTEQEALNAGTVSWEAEIFRDLPNWQKLKALKMAELTTEEKTFINGPVEQLCAMINHWQLQTTMNIPEQLWTFVKENGFLSMIIPKKYGGLEFSAYGHAQVITKIASSHPSLATIIGVPNSLGPAELLLQYGTEQQKNYYLPRLAKGIDIPCFALTSPVAGSDASSIIDSGMICNSELEGEMQLCIRLNWQKRYITLAPLATLIGLAFKLYDPDHLIGDEEECGITCALIPVNTPGIIIGRRHNPLHSAFPNGPTEGHDVIVPIHSIIGGREMAGQGWRMLMESLAAGRSISLPSITGGSAMQVALATGVYARVRRQFNTYIGSFGGVSETLTKIAAYTYLANALRWFTISGVDRGEKSALASALTKYHVTELSRKIIIDAMDVHGGKGICLGPNNYLASFYIESPIGITVEGANILTRSMIIFGQGIMRCHPYILSEIQAVTINDKKESLRKFDQAIFGHIGFLLSNCIRSIFLGLSRGYFSKTLSGPWQYYQRCFNRFAAVLSWLSDVMIIALGGELKRLEQISARLGDLLSYVYMGCAVIKYELVFGSPQFDKNAAVAEWICQELLWRLQLQLDNLIQNIPKKSVQLLCWLTTPWIGPKFRCPADPLSEEVTELLLNPGWLREQFSQQVYQTANENNIPGQLSAMLKQLIAAESIYKKLRNAQRQKEIHGKNIAELIEAAINRGTINSEEAVLLEKVEEYRCSIIDVDDFSAEEMRG